MTRLAISIALGLLVTWPAVAQKETRLLQIIVEGTTHVGLWPKVLASNVFTNMDVVVREIRTNGLPQSFVAGECDVALMSRPLSKDEFAACAANGIQPVPHQFAYCPTTVIVHPDNAITNLSLKQLRQVHFGSITNWSELGGTPAPIDVVARDSNSSPYYCFEATVMQGVPLKKLKQNFGIVGSMGIVRIRVRENPHAIGFQLPQYNNRNVRALAINGALPTDANVRHGRYPIVLPMFLYSNGVPVPGTPLHKLCTFHLTQEGRQLLRKYGLVPLTEE